MTSRKPLGADAEELTQRIELALAIHNEGGPLAKTPGKIPAGAYRALVDAKRLLSMLTPPPDAAVREAVERLDAAFIYLVDKRPFLRVYENGPLSHDVYILLRAVQSPRLEPSSEDREDEYTEKINAAHPLKTKRHALHDTAIYMVGNRHSKAALVDLVNWLLAGWEAAQATGLTDEQMEAVEAVLGFQFVHQKGGQGPLLHLLDELRAAFGLGEVGE